jgi:hypothetical protein
MSGLVRAVSFTGSLPGIRRAAIAEVYDRLGDYLLAIPQGEEERPGWIIPIVERTQMLDGMIVKKHGMFRDYGDVPQYEYRGGETLYIPHSVLGIAEEVSAAADVLYRLLGSSPANWGRPLQAGFPFASDHARFSLTADDAERFMPAFVDAMVREIEMVRVLLDDHVSIWLESPGSLLAMDTAAENGVNLEQMAALTAQGFAEAVYQLTPGAHITIHLCRGDLNHTSWFRGIESLEPMVVLANAIFEQWPHDHATLKAVHLPTCAADVLPQTNREFFQPLGDLATGLPVILGNVHEVVSVEQVRVDEAVSLNLRSLEMATNALGREAEAVSFSCGCRRMTSNQYEMGLAVLEGMIRKEGVHHKR